VFVDPRREHARQPPGEPIPSKHLAEFDEIRDAAAEKMSALLAEKTAR
jgi:hypothetical protein